VNVRPGDQQAWIRSAPKSDVMAPKRPAVAEALRRFDLEAASEMPDWHRAAFELRKALTVRPQMERKPFPFAWNNGFEPA
jgi:hypothetical protein